MGLIYKYAGYLWFSSINEMYRAIFKCIEPALGILLDLGVGDGENTLKIAKAIGVRKTIGIDIDVSIIKEASKKKIDVIRADIARDLPVADESIDVVFSSMCIEHMLDVDHFVTEVWRVLRPYGYAIITTDNLASIHNIVALVLSNQPGTGPTISTKYVIGFHPLMPSVTMPDWVRSLKQASTKHITVMAYKGIIKVFELYGFKVEKVIGCGYVPFPRAIGRLITKIDPGHSLFLVLKVRKASAI